MTNTLPVTQAVKNIAATMVAADSFSAANPGTAPTNTKLLYTAGANGSIVNSLMIATDDSGAGVYQIWASKDAGTTKVLKFMVAVPALSGQATLINVDVLTTSTVCGLAIDSAGRPILKLEANALLYACKLTGAIAASKTTYFTGEAEDF